MSIIFYFFLILVKEMLQNLLMILCQLSILPRDTFFLMKLGMLKENN